MYMCICIGICVNIYIEREREQRKEREMHIQREREREGARDGGRDRQILPPPWGPFESNSKVLAGYRRVEGSQRLQQFY